MITEDYCSFGLSKLLKEKGFEQHKTKLSYNKKGELNWSDNLDPFEFSAPTHQMAMKWLREVHRKYIDIRYNNQNEEYRFIVFTMVKDKPIDFIHSEYHSTYEEAVEAALKYVLENLI